MSLHKFAEQVAQHGRGDDSLLVHMTPDEVQRLQKFAEANGRSLTINPTTGLPEAGMLSDLFKAVAPIALGAFLGPGAFGIAGLGLSAGTAGLITGGLTTLATGSLSRGLMAGLGAYGGAGLAQGFADAGANALGAQGTAGALGVEGAATGAGSQAAMLAEQTSGFGTEGLSRLADSAKVASGASPVMPSTGTLMSKGFEAAGASPMQFAKDNWKSLAAASAPIMAGAMVPTTTSMPTSGNTGFIRQKIVNPDGTVRDLTPVKASEWGSRNFSDVYRGYNGGGIVALAGGGVPGYAGGMLVGDQDVFNYFKGLDQAKLGSGALDAQIAADMQKYNVSAADIARITGTQGQQGDYERRFVQAINTPGTSAEEFQAMTSDVGLQGQALANALQGSGMSQAAQYASTHGLSDVGGALDAQGKPIDFYNKIGYTAGALPGDQGGLEGLYANINYSAKGLQDKINAGQLTVDEAQRLADAEMRRVGVSQSDLKSATGKDLFSLFTPKPVTPPTTITPGETKLDTATTYDNGAFGNYGSGNKTGVDYLGRTVSIATPGDIITNPDQTRTVTPNIPGRPYGGFTGMDQVKSAYTAGGGSLGYTSKAPRTIAEFDQLYNKQTGDSLAAYDYLMGKGAGKYPTKSGVGEIARPYAEATLGYPVSTNKMYNWDPVAGKMVRNLDYVAPGRDSSGNVTYGMSLNDIKKTLAAKPLEGQALYDWAKTNNLSAQDIADATGRTLSSVYADFRAGSKAAADTAKTGGDSIQVTDSSGYNTETITAVKQADGTYLGGNGKKYDASGKEIMAGGGMSGYAMGGGLGSLGAYSDGGRLLRGPGDGVSDSIPATIGAKQQPARLADGEFVIPARIVSELGNGSTDAGAKKLYAMMDRVQKARSKTTGKNKVAANSRADKYLPA